MSPLLLYQYTRTELPAHKNGVRSSTTSDQVTPPPDQTHRIKSQPNTVSDWATLPPNQNKSQKRLFSLCLTGPCPLQIKRNGKFPNPLRPPRSTGLCSLQLRKRQNQIPSFMHPKGNSFEKGNSHRKHTNNFLFHPQSGKFPNPFHPPHLIGLCSRQLRKKTKKVHPTWNTT